MEKFFKFVKSSPTAYHTVKSVKEALISNGYTEISERDTGAFSDGKAHFVMRSDSSLIAFRGSGRRGFMICASHSDAPSFKVKNLAEKRGDYARLSVEKYGGMINYSWLDRPLSLAGRVAVATECGVDTHLVNIDRDLLVIPSVAIHLNRELNEGYKFNPAKDLLPLFGDGEGGARLLSLLGEAAGVSEEKIICADLYLYNRDEPRRIGGAGEYILSPRVDDLSCVYSSLTAFLSSTESEAVPVLAVFDSEEVGSATRQGADSSFLESVLCKIAGGLVEYDAMLAESLMVSADVAHAKHPNLPELSDSEWAPLLGKGVVIKHNAQKRYTTDALSEALFKIIANRAGVPTQNYANRADIPGGSTLGAISASQVPVLSLDVGIPQLAMHSASETMAVKDLGYMTEVLREFFSSYLLEKDGGFDILK